MQSKPSVANSSTADTMHVNGRKTTNVVGICQHQQACLGVGTPCLGYDAAAARSRQRQCDPCLIWTRDGAAFGAYGRPTRSTEKQAAPSGELPNPLISLLQYFQQKPSGRGVCLEGCYVSACHTLLQDTPLQLQRNKVLTNGTDKSAFGVACTQADGCVAGATGPFRLPRHRRRLFRHRRRRCNTKYGRQRGSATRRGRPWVPSCRCIQKQRVELLQALKVRCCKHDTYTLECRAGLQVYKVKWHVGLRSQGHTGRY